MEETLTSGKYILLFLISILYIYITIADFCGVIADPCGVVAIHEAIGGRRCGDADRCATR